jgi:hypothetical protein
VVYDNLMIALGSYIGAGPLLQALTIPHFAGHALITPIWIAAAFVFINSGEVIMSASLVLTLVFLRKREAKARLRG